MRKARVQAARQTAWHAPAQLVPAEAQRGQISEIAQLQRHLPAQLVPADTAGGSSTRATTPTGGRCSLATSPTATLGTNNAFVDQTCYLLPAPTMQRSDLPTAVSTIPPDLDRAAALDLNEQEPEGSDDADEEAGHLEDLKVVVSIKGGRATIGVQRPSSDPHIESFDGRNLSELTQEAQAAVERARASGDVAQPRLGDRTSNLGCARGLDWID